MLPKFEQFIRERQYLTNVSPATLEWYKHSLKWLRTEQQQALAEEESADKKAGLRPGPVTDSHRIIAGADREGKAYVCSGQVRHEVYAFSVGSTNALVAVYSSEQDRVPAETKIATVLGSLAF
jgi:hypothetical protein